MHTHVHVHVPWKSKWLTINFCGSGQSPPPHRTLWIHKPQRRALNTMYVCLCVFMYTNKSVYVCVQIFTRVCTFLCVYAYVCTCACLYPYACVCVYVCTSMLIPICTCMWYAFTSKWMPWVLLSTREHQLVSGYTASHIHCQVSYISRFPIIMS